MKIKSSDLTIIKNDETFDIELYNIYGQKMTALQNMKGNQQINIANYDTGVYTVIISSKGKILETTRIIKI